MHNCELILTTSDEQKVKDLHLAIQPGLLAV